MRRLSFVAVSGAAFLSLSLVPQAFAAPDAPAPQAAAAPSKADPWERFNRAGFAVHQALDRAILRPVAMFYLHATPRLLREGIHNVLSNLTEPAVGANDLMQGRFHRAGLTVGRIVANSTLGLGGIFDVASGMGAPHHDNGFDVTLGRYHVGSGPYLFIPLAGPTSIRGIVGVGVDSLLDPLHWVSYPHRTAISVGRVVLNGIDVRASVDGQLQALMSDATDQYATLRSVYLQNEESQIHDGEPAAAQPLPDFDDPNAAPVPAAQPAAPAPAADAPPAPAEPAAAPDAPAPTASTTPAPPPAAPAPQP